MTRPYTETKRGTVGVRMQPSRLDGEDLHATVPAYLAGPYLALHRPVSIAQGKRGAADTFRTRAKSWVITHVPTGRSVASCYHCPRTFSAARRCMLALANDPFLDWDCTAEDVAAWPKATRKHVRDLMTAACDKVQP